MNEKKKVTVLVVDDQDIFLSALVNTLSAEGYSVVPANNGEAALAIFEKMPVDVVISDIRMPGINGIALLKAIKNTKPVPFVLTTGFAEIQNTHQAFELGADAFLPKPFKKSDLLSTLESVLENPEDFGEIEEMQDDQFCPIPIQDFISGSSIRYDIHIRLSNSKYVKIAHSGENLSPDRIKKFLEKNVKYLYLTKNDYRNYVGFMVEVNQIISKSDKASQDKKVKVLKMTGELILTRLHLEGIDRDSFEFSKDIIETTVSLFSDNPTTLELLDILNNHSDYLYAHSLGVSFYATMIAKKMGWRSAGILFKVAAAGLFHDIGKKEIDRVLLDKPRVQLNAEEIKIVEGHTHRGAEILSSIPGMGEEIVQVAMQHHENCLGTGFPKRLPSAKISPLSKLIAVANEFCKLAIKNPDCPGMPPKAALQRLHTVHGNTLDSSFLNCLESFFG